MKERLGALLRIKSIVTLLSTLAFTVLALMERVSAREFLTVYTVIISFYFGTQHEKKGESR